MANFRAQIFSSLIVLPTTNALGHLAPAIGASWAAVGTPIWDYPVLVLLLSVHILLDSYDKYRDMARELRPSAPLWLLWVGTLTSLISWSSYECGYSTAIRIVWFLGLEILWAGPFVPFYTPNRGFGLVKLKQVFGPLKSVFCGVMAGLMDSDPASVHACTFYPGQCASNEQRMKALAYSMLYNFIRETVYDVRDIVEDSQDNITTLATSLGMTGTILVLAIAAAVGEVCVGGGASFLNAGRVLGVVGLSSWMASQPREHRTTWALYSLSSLVPAWHAQAGLGHQIEGRATAGVRRNYA